MRALWLLVALLAAGAVQAAPPRAFSAEYEVLRNGQPLGRAILAWRALPDGRWELSTRTRGTAGLAALAGAKVDEVSVLRWSGGKPETVTYRYRQDVAFKSRERSLDVDPANRRVDSRDRDRRHVLDWQPGLLDRHALTVAVMQDVADGRRGELAYVVADRDRVQAMRFEVAANVRLRTALGTMRAVRVERVHDGDSGKQTKLWLARERGWLPLRIKQYDADGDTVDLRIIAIR